MTRSHFLGALLSVACLVTANGTSYGAGPGGHGGGGHAGGGHAGGGHAGGGVHMGSVHSGGAYGGVYHGSVNHGIYGGNVYRGGAYNYGYGLGRYNYGLYGYGLGAGYYSPYLYSSPYYGGANYSYYPPTTVIVQGQQPIDPQYQPQQLPQQQPPANQPAPKNAEVKVLLPDAQAKVWFDGNATTSTGAERIYHTPDLTAGATNTYRIRASWIVNGKEVVQEQVVPVQAGRGSIVDFTRPASEGVAPPPAKQ